MTFFSDKMKIVIVGKSSSGKDFLKNELVKQKGLRPGISCTTRPPRKGEKDGETYHFISPIEFERGIFKEYFLEWQIFNGWYYGTRKQDWEKANVFIMTPLGIEDIISQIEGVTTVYLDIDLETRVERMNKRIGNADSVERRIIADEKDFQNFSCYTIRTTNPLFKINDIWKLL